MKLHPKRPRIHQSSRSSNNNKINTRVLVYLVLLVCAVCVVLVQQSLDRRQRRREKEQALADEYRQAEVTATQIVQQVWPHAQRLQMNEILQIQQDQKQQSTSSDTQQSSGGGFSQIVQTAVHLAESPEAIRNITRPSSPFSVAAWPHTRKGGLTMVDRAILGKLYERAYAVFEWGLGESSLIADAVGVPCYAGIDSDPGYVASTRQQVTNHHFRFYTADIGNTIDWGKPADNYPKNILTYQMAPLLAEPHAFHVYLVDGRYRFPCLLTALLHACQMGKSDTTNKDTRTAGSSASSSTRPTLVLVHDCQRPHLHQADHLLHHVQAAGSRLCIFQRKPSTTDEQLVELWRTVYRDTR